MQFLELEQIRKEVRVRDYFLDMLRQEAVDASQILSSATLVIIKHFDNSSITTVGFVTILCSDNIASFFYLSIPDHEPCAGGMLLWIYESFLNECK